MMMCAPGAAVRLPRRPLLMTCVTSLHVVHLFPIWGSKIPLSPSWLLRSFRCATRIASAGVKRVTVIPMVRANIESQCNLIAKGGAKKEEVVEHTLKLFCAKLRCDEFCSSPGELSEARLRLYG